MKANPPRPHRSVVFVIHSLDRGGSGRVAGYLARGFAEAGFGTELLVIAQGGEVEEAVSALIAGAAKISYLRSSTGIRPLDLVLGLPALARRLRADRPDVVIGAANNIALVVALAVWLARLGETRLFLKTTNPIASSRHRGIVRWIRRLTYRLAFRRAQAVWTLSADESREMEQAFPEFAGLFHAVPNPYVTAAMLAPAGRPANDDPRPTVICVARLHPQKRLERLIAAFAHVRFPDARLLILGEGEQRAGLTALVERLGLGQRIAMPGQVADVAPALHAADLFVLTSDYEGLPAALLEAMAANCPVLSTDCFPAARSLLESAEGCGIIEDLAPQAIAALIDERLAAPRPTGLRAVAERYSIPAGIAGHIGAMDRYFALPD